MHGRTPALSFVALCVALLLAAGCGSAAEAPAPAGASTEAPTQAPAATPGEAPTEAPTEAATEVATEATTEAATEVATEAGTEAPTEAAPPAAAGAPYPPVTGEYKLTAHTIASQALAGNLLGDPAERKYIVLAPPGYDEGEQRYPVVYVLHWFEGDEYTHVSQFARAWSGLMEDGLIRPMILVFPNADNAYDGSMYLSNPVQGDYGAYITQELVSQVDAEYRTLAQRESRGVAGCSMGGNGALHLAFTYPDVFSAAAALSGIFDWSTTPTLAAVEEEGFPPVEEPGETARLTLAQKFWYALAAAAAPNPDAPPLYLDPPFRAVEGDPQRKAEPVPEVMERIFAADPQDDARRYLEQPERLNGLLIYSGEFDPLTPAELAQAFSEELTGMGIENEFLLDDAGHCTMDFAPVFPFMDAHLAFEQQ